MKTEPRTERFNMFFTPSELKAIEDWRYANRVPTLSEAVRRLIVVGLEMTQEGGAS